jgi:hypothetical protein
VAIYNRHQVAVEARSAHKGSSLVNDNADQRRASLLDKIATHERSRAFYMPGFDPAPQDADQPAERVPLHLPSSISVLERARVCRVGLVDAETEIRLSAMGDSVIDLVWHLQTRTFLHRYNAQETTGVQTKTRARDTIAGVSR